jgi:hypothetical protein
MKGILALAAVSVLASGAAEARPVVKEISLDGFCNIFHTTFANGVLTAQDTPSCSGMYGGGFVGSVKNFGKSATLSIEDPSMPGTQWILVLSYPIVSGGTYKLYYTTDGNMMVDDAEGTYSLVTPEMGAKTGRSVTSTIRR